MLKLTGTEEEETIMMLAAKDNAVDGLLAVRHLFCN